MPLRHDQHPRDRQRRFSQDLRPPLLRNGLPFNDIQSPQEGRHSSAYGHLSGVLDLLPIPLGEWQTPGALACELDCLLAEASVQHRGPDLKHAVRTLGRQRICRRLFMRALTKWLTVPSAREAEIGLPAR